MYPMLPKKDYENLSRIQEIDKLLLLVCETLQLDETRRARADSAYLAVGSLLESDPNYFGANYVNIFSHGSFSLGTTSKPLNKEEYDLDAVFYIDNSHINECPIEILDKLEKKLKDNEVYKDKVERKNRCIRLNYAGDFHMDIQPSFPNTPPSSPKDYDIRVPDRLSQDWVFSSPKKYTLWFKSAYLEDLDIRNFKNSTKVKAQEALPAEQSVREKQPIQRAVQLFKRLRDIYFDKLGLSQEKPSSVVLTTLTRESYKGDLSEFMAIKEAVNYTRNRILNEGQNFHVWNPVNSYECFTDKWIKEPQRRTYFEEFIFFCHKNLDKLLYIQEMHEIERIFTPLIGETLSKKVLGLYKEKNKSLGLLKSIAVINSGNAYTDRQGKITNDNNNVKNQPHRFYGD